MPRMPSRMGKVQLEIMRILWQRGRATAREITEAMGQAQPIAHSTVQTLLRQLQAKGAVTYDVEDRTFIYRPLYRQSEVAETAARDLVARLFNGSAFSLMTHLLKHEEISPEDLTRLRELIDREKKP
jgi:BlaI family penicillinase repressor